MTLPPLIIGEIEIPCYVLENKQRVITQRGFQKALGMSSGGGTGGAQRIMQFANSRSINPFISNELRARMESTIKFQTPTGIATGYDALLLSIVFSSIF